MKAYAKINLFLDVKNKREDGYHNIETVMALINLYDEIEAEKDQYLSLSSDLFIEDNIIMKIARYLKKEYNVKEGARLKLTKRIPLGSGLGGESSDAATTIKLLNDFWHLNLDLNQMIEIGKLFGSDITFFLTSFKQAIVKGRGEIVEEIKLPLDYYKVVLFNSNIGISTKEIYDNYQISELKNLNEALTDLKSNDLSVFRKGLYNALYKVVEEKYEEIKKTKKELERRYTFPTLLTGTGSTIYMIAKEKDILYNQPKLKDFNNLAINEIVLKSFIL